MISDKLELGIILNPAAGRGHAIKIKSRLTAYLRSKGIPFNLELTNGPGDAIQIATRMSGYAKTIVAAGGDGTVNEIVSGIAGSKSTLAILPIGSGNDYSKAIGIPDKIKNAMDTVFTGKKKLMDVGKAVYWNKSGEKKERHFVNTLGMGLDAEIAKETKKIKYLRGLPLYLLAAFKAIAKHRPNEYELNDKSGLKKFRSFLVCAGNGCYEGGGFKLLPDAKPDDSLLDICVLGTMPIIRAISILPKLINGKHGGLEEVSIWKTKKLELESKNPFILHGDGEIFEEETTHVEISIEKNQISYITA